MRSAIIAILIAVTIVAALNELMIYERDRDPVVWDCDRCEILKPHTDWRTVR